MTSRTTILSLALGALLLAGCQVATGSGWGGAGGKADDPTDTGECVPQGEGFEDFNTEGHCCEGLVAIPASYPSATDDTCVTPRCPCFVCSACGNGIQDLGENPCNCPADFAPEPECVGEGDGFESFTPEGMCCEGLVAVSADVVVDGVCSSPRCPCFTCTACGNGTCGDGENVCNCPEDCPAEPECVGEGEGFESFTPEGMCCEGLVAVSAAVLVGGECSAPRCPCFTCTACGNGTCGEGENECNCAEDCPPEPECLGQGEGFEDFNTDGHCCEGLTPITASRPVDDTCTEPRCPCFVCAVCGDGECLDGENRCNCPEDCL